MGRQLYRDYPTFRECVHALDLVYSRIVGVSLIDSTGLFNPSQNARILPDVWPIDIILPSIAIIQVALVDLLHALGIVPDFVIGHSAGETAMLYACGAVPREVVVELAIARGRALRKTESVDTTMAAVSCEASAAQVMISEICGRLPDGVLDIACHNADYAVTVAGTSLLVDELISLCTQRGISAQRLRTHVAVHSSVMEHCEAEFRSGISDVFSRHHLDVLKPRTASVYSCVSGRRIDDTIDAEYLWKNTRQPVLFRDSVKAVTRDTSGAQIVIMEIGPHPVLSGYLTSLLPENSVVIPSMRRTKLPSEYHERAILLRAVGTLVNCGFNDINFSVLNGNVDHLVSFPLPPYPFSRKLIPMASQYSGQSRALDDWKGPLNFPRLRMNAATHPDLAEHVMNGEPIVPATGFIEMVSKLHLYDFQYSDYIQALEFGASTLWNIKFHTFLPLSQEEPRPVQVKLNGTRWSVTSTRKEDKYSPEVTIFLAVT